MDRFELARLHTEVLNIQVTLESISGFDVLDAYKMGHRHARHAAAALILAGGKSKPDLARFYEGLGVEPGRHVAVDADGDIRSFKVEPFLGDGHTCWDSTIDDCAYEGFVEDVASYAYRNGVTVRTSESSYRVPGEAKAEERVWRLLNVGEMTMFGDEWYSRTDRAWLESGIGFVVGRDHAPLRRSVELPQ